MRVNYLISILGCLFLAKCNNAHPTCAGIYGISVNHNNYLEANFNVAVSMKKLGLGIELELIFVFNQFPFEDDIPRYHIRDKEFRFGTNTDDNDNNFIDLSCPVAFGSGKKYPNIGKISIRYANETVVVCENIQELTSGKVLVRVMEKYQSDAALYRNFGINNYIQSELKTVLSCEIVEKFPLKYCALNATLTKDHTVVVIQGYQSDLLTLQLFGEIYRLSSVFCEKFPELMVMEADSLSLEHIDENAFHKCTKLRKLNLMHNNLAHIPPKAFEKSNKLQILNLQFNKIQSFMWSGSLKYLPNLQSLSVEITQLFQFNIDEIEVMESMRYLNLRGIEIPNNNVTSKRNYVIPSIDEKKFHEKFPNLQRLVLADDTFESEELNRIKEFFIKYGVNCCTSESHFSDGI